MRARGRLGRRIVDNPFYVLALPTSCSRAEIERVGQKLLGMLELGLTAARTYATPLGRFERNADKVREAMAELRDPDRRLGHELWASLRVEPESPAQPDQRVMDPPEHPGRHETTDRPGNAVDVPEPIFCLDALATLGWRRR